MSKEDIDTEEHFKNWYQDIEGFSIRGERIYNDIMVPRNEDKDKQWDMIHFWIKNAYCIGFREGRDYQDRQDKA